MNDSDPTQHPQWPKFVEWWRKENKLTDEKPDMGEGQIINHMCWSAYITGVCQGVAILADAFGQAARKIEEI